MKMHIFFGIAAPLAFSVTTLRADDVGDRSAKLSFLAPAEVVVSVMQRQPDESESFMIAGIPAERWRWIAQNGRTVVVTMVEGHVIMTKVCTGIPNC